MRLLVFDSIVSLFVFPLATLLGDFLCGHMPVLGPPPSLSRHLPKTHASPLLFPFFPFDVVLFYAELFSYNSCFLFLVEAEDPTLCGRLSCNSRMKALFPLHALLSLHSFHLYLLPAPYTWHLLRSELPYLQLF